MGCQRVLSPQEQRIEDHTIISNARILGNFDLVCDAFPALPKRVRTPVIPGFNDREDDIRAIADDLRGPSGLTWELLPSHRMGLPKYATLGRDEPLGDETVDDAVLLRLRELTVP